MKLQPFQSDGCSGGMSWAWRTFAGKAPPWEGHCVEHDRAYHVGGPAWQRMRADEILREAVIAQGYPGWAWVIYVGVRLFGGPFWPVSWRWGFGWPDVGGYRRLAERCKATNPDSAL